MSEHTKEPWLVDGDYLVTEGGSRIAVFTHYADVKRVKACVDACAGIDTESLEKHTGQQGLIYLMSDLVQQRNELLAALKELLPAYRKAVKLYDSNHDDAYTVKAHTAIDKVESEK